jgi:hypothetical protein
MEPQKDVVAEIAEEVYGGSCERETEYCES